MLNNFKNYRARPAAPRLLGLALLLWLMLGSAPAFALRGFFGAHDPSTIVKDGNKYWVFTTGVGIPSLYSTDLLNWTAAPRPVFTNSTKPSWISTKVPGFVDNYWAPECFYMNGKFYLYYSCSTFGSKVSGIGLATNVTLDPTSPSYNWVDEGEVISSDNSSAANAIDPAIYRDASNNVWFTYGSFFGGIRILQLNAATGKPLNGTSTTQYAVANGGVEAAYVKLRGGFYYLFINRGNCCQGANSTYYIQVGRSTSPSGPFLDRNGVNLNSNGGTTILSSAGKYVGPGHTGIFEENGVSYFSMHYYDLDNSGAPKLDVAKLTWDAAGWPVVSRNWLEPGRYTLANASSGQRWQAAGCTTAPDQRIVQGSATSQSCQQWDATVLGEGTYQFVNVLTGQSAGTVNCSTSAGTPLQMETSSGSICQEFALERAADGSFVFGFLNRVVEVAGGATTAGAALQLGNYSATSTSQRWRPANIALGTSPARQLTGVSIYPVPAGRGGFTVSLGAQTTPEATTVAVYNLQGQRVYGQTYGAQRAELAVPAALAPGLYLVQVRRGEASTTQKLTVE